MIYCSDDNTIQYMASIYVVVKCTNLHNFMPLLSYARTTHFSNKIVSRKWWWNTQSDSSWVQKKKLSEEKKNSHSDTLTHSLFMSVCVNLCFSMTYN